MMTEQLDIRNLEVQIVDRECGALERASQFAFTYVDGASEDLVVSITMPVRRPSYFHGALFPIFEMNLPEGYVRRYIHERMRKHAVVDDMLFLALANDCGIGRLSYQADGIEAQPIKPAVLETILNWDAETSVFSDLVDRYLMQTSAGISGVQPKVLVPEERGTLTLPTLIVKSGDDEYPGLAVNEFLCMSIAREAGLPTPEFWLSDDHRLFVMRRFDILGDGTRLGMEDFSVLMGRPGDRKYEGRVETLMKAARLYGLDTNELYEQIVLSMLVGNGDAHLKNFAILYSGESDSRILAPLYDVVCTRAYDDHKLALAMAKSRDYPSRRDLIRLGERFDVANPDRRIDRIAGAVSTVLTREVELVREHPAIGRWIDKTRSETSLHASSKPRRHAPA